MNNFSGFGGGNMQQLLKQAQKMQQDLIKNKEEVENSTVTSEAGGGAVSVVMTGKMKIESITIKKEAVDPEDVETLEDLIKAAVNGASDKIDKLKQDKMGGMPNGLV